MGREATSSRTAPGSTGANPAFSDRLEALVHTPTFDRKAPVEVFRNPPWLSRVESDWRKNPPWARAMNWFTPEEAMSAFWESAHTKAPSWLALALRPAAKLVKPVAVFWLPPPTVATRPLAVLLFPPATVAAMPLAVLEPPPPTVARTPLAVLVRPPPTVA